VRFPWAGAEMVSDAELTTQMRRVAAEAVGLSPQTVPSAGLDPVFADRWGRFLSALDERGIKHRVTSTISGHHNVGSLHFTGQAGDLVLADPSRGGEAMQLARQIGLVPRNEMTRPSGQAVWGGPHYHFQLASRGVSQGDWRIPDEQVLADVTARMRASLGAPKGAAQVARPTGFVAQQPPGVPGTVVVSPEGIVSSELPAGAKTAMPGSSESAQYAAKTKTGFRVYPEFAGMSKAKGGERGKISLVEQIPGAIGAIPEVVVGLVNALANLPRESVGIADRRKVYP